MKKFFIIPLLAVSALFAVSCSEWDDHFDATGISSTGKVNVYNGDIMSYMKAASDVSKMSAIYEQNGIYEGNSSDKSYTFIVCDDADFDASAIDDAAVFAKYCVADMEISPSLLKDGFGIMTRSGKSIWVHGSGNDVKLDNYSVKKTVKTDNGYVYYVDGMLPVRKSVYEYLMSLDDRNYSMFKKLVAMYDTTWFDREHSTIIGVGQDGSTIYDSVIVVRNTLMDRYTSDGQEVWNMRDENYNSTIFIPTNAQITKAIKDARDSIPQWLNREATAADSAKFSEWIVKACFVDRKLAPEEVVSSASDFNCVGGYMKIIDEQADRITYESTDAAYWRPSVQHAKASEMVQLSNGNAYFLDNFKIPNHVVIYRVKSRMYEIWNALSDPKKKDYFIWANLVDPLVINDAQGSFFGNTQPMGDWPDVFYNIIAAIPSEEAVENGLPCSVTFTGLAYNEDDETVYECNLPAGEYYLRMGFVHSLTYGLSIYFNDDAVVTDMPMKTTGSNYHFDRSGASDAPVYGTTYQTGFPEGFKPSEWVETNENANLYDTDGWTVGVVRLKKSGTFKIRVSSKDLSRIWGVSGNVNRDKNNKNQFMMYHWCLRPTPNNY
ncbi:hypothetical protein [Xylanibacter muris]|uniref:FAS1 domain-containing protein n=1 Tax=Xylanibacter muris TaxID=2736290 RepID=A0ABX2AJ01_9BACT|nr:hypothetical protein [Xylanibacter muris]NPD90965.1 hypothetical protein [Xylanibacter muris]